MADPIHINPAHAGEFTAFAKRLGMSVQAAARHVLANPKKYGPKRVKQANFAKNAAHFKHVGRK
ncbi:MAG: hypothetical protein ACYDB1_01145 [Acidiferrobacteraceae bacterium]